MNKEELIEKWQKSPAKGMREKLVFLRNWITIFFNFPLKMSYKTSRYILKHVVTLCQTSFCISLMCLNPRRGNDQQRLICDAK